MKKYEIYIGSRDKDSLDVNNFREFLTCLEQIFSNGSTPFSMTRQLGGYLHENGNYILEFSLKVTYIGEPPKLDVVKRIQRLKRFLNQESLLLVISDINAEYR